MDGAQVIGGPASTNGRGGAPLVVGIGGTPREHSTTERALRAALVGVERAGAKTMLFGAADLDLPMYAPERADRTPAAGRLVEALRVADGVIIASPGYHGGVSGMVKNALDYTEELRDDARPYLDGRPVGCIVCASGWQATATTLSALRSIVHALRGWPTPLGVTINSARQVFGPDGNVIDDAVAEHLTLLGEQIIDFTRREPR
jgi:FMN reductase